MRTLAQRTMSAKGHGITQGHRVVRCLLVSIALAGAAVPAFAQEVLTPDLSGIPDAKVEAIRQHLRAAGVGQIMEASFEATLEAQREMTPGVPAVFWEEFSRRIVSDIDRFMEALIPLYHEQFTLEELEGLTAFYRSPLGQRLVEAAAELAPETSALGEQWGAVVGAEVLLDLANRGVYIGN